MANIIYRNQANKIFIYNSAEEVANDECAEQKNTSSITILTSGIPEYHIRIKNNYNSESAKSLEDFEDAKEIKTNLSEPQTNTTDTKTQRNTFSLNEDVLLKSNDDNKLYLGTIVSVKNGNYLVKFDDNTEKWSCEGGLKKLNSSLNKSKNSDDPLCVICKEKSETDVVEVCNKCSRGYHRHCIQQDSSNFSSPWCCDRCTASEIISISDSEDNEFDENDKLKTYDDNSLEWDSRHRENKEQIYCYCRSTGSWKKQMLQCCKCQQWFHDRCLSSWQGYLLHGDMHFVFCCKGCNYGTEFIHRLSLNWKVAIHLVLYEFHSTRHQQKYFSISKDVAPYFWDKWDQLNLPLVKYHSKEKLLKKISQMVKHEGEFKSIGGNNKQKSDSVCLRRKVPPEVCRNFVIPTNIVVSEKTLKTLNIKSFPLNDSISCLKDCKPNETVETKPLDISSRTKSRKKSNKISEASYNIPTLPPSNDDSSDENSSKSTLDWIIPPPSNFHGMNNPFHSQYKSNTKYKSSDKMIKRGQQNLFDKQPETRIVRTIKRRLSAKDIAMGSNRETKRRKNMKRRKSCDVEIISEIIQHVNMPIPSYIPVRGGDFKPVIQLQQKEKRNETSYNIQTEASKSSRQQRQCRGKNIVDKIRKNSLESFSLGNQSSVKISLTDAVINSPVKNKAINLYFGAFNRIENGENFTILAKRLTFDGKEQYLLDWEASNGTPSCAYKEHVA